MGMGTDGIPTTDNIREATEKLGCPTDNIPVTTEINPTTDFLKNLILSYSLKIKQNTYNNNS
jgi:hypothetical protein